MLEASQRPMSRIKKTGRTMFKKKSGILIEIRMLKVQTTSILDNQVEEQ